MPITTYDPDEAPNPKEWLALDEGERNYLVHDFHEVAQIDLPDLEAHTVIHTIVENQIALGFAPSCRAVMRLQGEGLSRHDAIHAIGSVVARLIFESIKGSRAEPPETLQSQLGSAIELLTASQQVEDVDN
jgi:hypothetical protein